VPPWVIAEWDCGTLEHWSACSQRCPHVEDVEEADRASNTHGAAGDVGFGLEAAGVATSVRAFSFWHSQARADTPCRA